jgi:hypothetical protein
VGFDVWVLIKGCPEPLCRDFLAMFGMGSLIGKTEEVDMKFMRENGIVRARVSCLNPMEIPQSVSHYYDGEGYNIEFVIESVDGESISDDIHGEDEIDDSGNKKKDGNSKDKHNKSEPGSKLQDGADQVGRKLEGKQNNGSDPPPSDNEMINIGFLAISYCPTDSSPLRVFEPARKTSNTCAILEKSNISKVFVEGETVSMYDDSLRGEDKISLDPPSDSVEEATAAHGLLPQQDLLAGSMLSIPRQTSSSLPRQDTAADLLLRQEVAVSQLAPELVSKPQQVSAATPSLGLSGAAVGVTLDGGNVHDRNSFGALYSPKNLVFLLRFHRSSLQEVLIVQVG